MAEIRVNTTGTLKLFDADDSHSASIAAGTITADVTAMTLNNDSVDFIEDIKLGDNSKAIFGASSDLEILHNSSSGNSFISDVGTGSLIISANQTLFQNAAKSETLMQLNEDSDVKLYHDNSEKLATTSSGIDVTGLVEFDSLSGTGSVAITDIADEDDMTSNSATKLSTQQSIKAYADTKASAGFAVAMAIAL